MGCGMGHHGRVSFDNIDHTVLLEIIQRDIHDGRLVKLIDGLLKAGYMSDWKYHETASGTPQGGIISPLLANIYLNALDRFIEDTLIPAYTKGKGRRQNPEYERIRGSIRRARKRGDRETILRLKRELRKLTSVEMMDENYRRLRYVRYADDFLLGFAGTENEAKVIRDRLAEHLKSNLKLDLSKEKTLITHASSEKAKFLGYEITVTRANDLIAENGKRAANGGIALLMPRKVVTETLSQFSRGGKIIHKPELLSDDVYSIIYRYQSVLRGIYNYFCMAINVARRLHRIQYILETSLTKTLASKLRISVKQVYRDYRFVNPSDGQKVLRIIVERPNKGPLIAYFGGIPFERKPQGMGDIDFHFDESWFRASGKRSEIIQRLLSDKCELCGAAGPVQMHHIRRLADLNEPGRKSKLPWQKIMSARRRKSLAVCRECHENIHAGRHDGPSPAKLTGEPDALKGARPVRRGAVGKGTQTQE